MRHFIGGRYYEELYHVTPLRSFKRIETVGLRIKMAQGALRAIWFCDEERLDWAFAHVAVHHKEDPTCLRAFSTLIPVDVLTYRGRGVWTLYSDVPAWALKKYVPSENTPLSC